MKVTLSWGRLNTAFSAAKYVESHHIEPHDDRAYADVRMEDGSVVQCSREIAVIYYLTKDWDEEFGGALIDCKTGNRYVPEYNSVVAFTIPRYHEVRDVFVCVFTNCIQKLKRLIAWTMPPRPEVEISYVRVFSRGFNRLS